MFAIKKSINTLKWPNPKISKLQPIRDWSQILEFYISYQFYLVVMCYTKIRKDENKFKYHWFDIIQPIRPHLRWKFFTIVCKICHDLIFYVIGKVENFDGMNCFFLHCHPISYFIIHVCNQKINKPLWNDWIKMFKLHQSGWCEILEFYISWLMCYKDKKRWKQVKHHWFDIVQPIRLHLRSKFFTIGCKVFTILFSMWQEKLKILMEWNVFSFIAILFLIS